MNPGGGSEGTQPSTTHVMLGWGLVLVATVGIFMGTLLLKPKTTRS